MFINVYINNTQLKVKKNSTVLEACEQAGILVPRFCYHEDLKIAGNCRMCLVEIEKAPKPVAACAFPVSNNLRVYTDTPLVKKARENVIEFLLINHPLDCPICDQGGECDLQEQTLNYGSDRSRFFNKKRPVEDKNCGPIVKTIMTRCIHCTRCVRFFEEIAGETLLGTTARGKETEIGSYIETHLISEFSGNVVDLCPVGALTSKPYAFTTRPWELKSVDTIDIMDGIGSNIRIDYKDSEIFRVLPRVNDEINEKWISNNSRFSFESTQINRLYSSFLKNQNNWVKISWKNILQTLVILLKFECSKKEHLKNSIQIILGSRLSYTEIILLKQFALNFNFSHHKEENLENENLLAIARSNTNLINLNLSDLILTIGTDPQLEASIYNLKIIKRSKNGNFTKASIGLYNTDWRYDNLSLGNSLKVFYEVLEGKNKFCKHLTEAKFPIIVINSRFFRNLKPTALIQLLSYLNRHVKIIKNDWFGFDTISFMPNYLVGNKKSYKTKTRPSIVYSINSSKRKKKTENAKFYIYQDSNMKEKILDNNILLIPNATIFESTEEFINLEGRKQTTRKVFTKPDFIKSNKEIIQILNLILTKHRLELKEIKQKLLNFYENKIDFTKLIVQQTQFSNFYKKIYFSPLKSEINNFYEANLFCDSSITLSECAKIKTKNYFIF